MDISKYRILSRLFTRPIFTALASGHGAIGTLDFLVQHDVAKRSSTSRPVSDLLNLAFEKLSKNYRNEYVFKAALADKIIFGRHSPRTAAMQVELPIGRSIVDAAVFNGTSTAYEIKTELDSSKRLATQTRDYLTVFDKVFVVTTKLCAPRYDTLADPRVGILTLSERGNFSVYRDAISNKENVDPRSIFRSLRKSEFLKILAEEGRSINVPNALLHEKCEGLFKQMSPLRCHDAFLSAMRFRTTDSRSATFLNNLPTSLRSLGFATPFSEVQRKKVEISLSGLTNLQLLEN
jgi:hypothetical protein